MTHVPFSAARPENNDTHVCIWCFVAPNTYLIFNLRCRRTDIKREAKIVVSKSSINMDTLDRLENFFEVKARMVLLNSLFFYNNSFYHHYVFIIFNMFVTQLLLRTRMSDLDLFEFLSAFFVCLK